MKKRKKGRIRQFEEQSQRQDEGQWQESRELRQQKKNSPKTSKKKKRKINRSRLFLTVIVLVLIAVVGMSVKTVFDLRAEQKQLEETKKNLTAEKGSLEEELKNVNDYDYIEEQARIQLKLIKPGEILYIINPEDYATEEGAKDDEEDN